MVHGVRVCFLTVFIIAIPINLSVIKTRPHHFHIFSPPSDLGPIRLHGPWKARSRLSCIAACLRDHGKVCRSVLFHRDTKICTPCTWLNGSEPLALAAEGDLYVRKSAYFCDPAEGFHLYKYNATYACVSAVTSPAMNYTEADEYCRGMGGFLMSVKTWDKLMILREAVAQNASVWVGLDDLVDEGKFVWREDDEEWTTYQHQNLFKSGEPNNQNGTEDCVQIKTSNLLNDAMCNLTITSACEL